MMPGSLAKEIGRLKNLLAALEALEAGTIDPQALKGAPLLDKWSHSSRKVPCLEGVVEGHPQLPDGEKIATSEAYVHLRADDEHFVRTLSRWYRLGEPRKKARSSSVE
jgi:hypothetical protein